MVIHPAFFIVAIAIIVLSLLIYTWAVHQRKKKYKAMFKYAVDKLTTLQEQANQLGQEAANIKDRIVLDYFEGCLGFMQTLVEALSLVNPKGVSSESLDSALVLTKECETRLDKARTLFDKHFSGESITLQDIYRDKRERYKGCYFCSCPIERNHFQLVKVRLEGTIRKVLSCDTCRHQLKYNKKVKVLHFSRNGKTMHWSEVDDYFPSKEYWNLNEGAQESVQQKTMELTLIPSEHHE